MSVLTPVRLTANYRIWNVGEVAGFEGEELAKILESGIAERLSSPEATPAEPAPIAAAAAKSRQPKKSK